MLIFGANQEKKEQRKAGRKEKKQTKEDRIEEIIDKVWVNPEKINDNSNKFFSESQDDKEKMYSKINDLKNLSLDDKSDNDDLEDQIVDIKKNDEDIDYFDFVECFKEANPSAVAAGNIFHFKEHSYYHAKKTLERSNIDIRTEYGVFN